MTEWHGQPMRVPASGFIPLFWRLFNVGFGGDVHPAEAGGIRGLREKR